MVLLNSEKSPLGSAAPDFELPGVDGKRYALKNFSDKEVLVIMFICSHCPYVQAIEDRLIQLRKNYEGKSVQLVGICSNDFVNYPEDSPEALKKRAEDKGYGFPYLVDETQEIAKSYGAVCTPDLFVFDKNRKLAYRGQLDNNWKEASKVTQKDLSLAVDKLLSGDLTPIENQVSSMGCSIKWK